MDAADVYFTWPDGRFRYECRGCGDCCKGLGIGLDATSGEVASLTDKYPGLVPFVRRRGPAWTAFNPRGQCWFLDGGLCRVEVDHGRAAKPASCRLFPFNRVFRLGRYAIVDYNSVICPLEVAPPGAGVARADVLAEISAIADPAVVGTELPADDPARDARRFVTREREIADTCFAAANRAGAEAARRAPTGDSMDDGDAPALIATTWRAQASEGTFAAACDRVDRGVRAVTGQPWRAPRRLTLAGALWLTPSLRFNELYGPRRWGPMHERDAALADVWLAWLSFAAQGAEVAGRALGLRELTSTWAEVMPVAFACARWTHVPTLEAETARAIVASPGGHGGDLRDVQLLAAACADNRARRTLGALLEPLCESRTPPGRVALVRALEPLLPHLRWRRRAPRR